VTLDRIAAVLVGLPARPRRLSVCVVQRDDLEQPGEGLEAARRLVAQVDQGLVARGGKRSIGLCGTNSDPVPQSSRSNPASAAGGPVTTSAMPWRWAWRTRRQA
jgi:hypothetical protein